MLLWDFETAVLFVFRVIVSVPTLPAGWASRCFMMKIMVVLV